MARQRNGSRWLPLGLVFITVVISFTDRSNLSLAAPKLSADLKLDSVKLGFVLSAFGWAYCALQLPGGWIVDRCALRLLYPVMMGVWSLFTGALGFARSAGGLFALRLGVGALEAPGFPANNKVVTAWYPEKLRARAIGAYTSGQFVGGALITPVLAILMVRYGWRSIFFITGAFGLIWSGVWYWLYRDPKDDPGGLKALERAPVTWPALRVILRSRNMWGVFIGHLCGTVSLWFLLTWLPQYLVKYRHMDFTEMGYWVASPSIAAFLGALSAGIFSDWLLGRGLSVTAARKTPVVAGAVLSMCIIGANYVQRPVAIMFFMSLAGFGHGFSSLGWVFISALAPAGLVGVTGGIYNFIGNFSAIFVPIVIGYLVRGGRFEPALVFVCCCAAIGALSFQFIVRDVGQLKLAANHDEIGRP